MIERYNIPFDDYPEHCINQIAQWKEEYKSLSSKEVFEHKRGHEYAAYIMESIITGTPYKIGGNVLNTGGLIENLPHDAYVEVPCLLDSAGIHPTRAGRLPVHRAAMNMTNINVQMLAIEAAVTQKCEHIYHAAMLDPHTASELSVDDIIKTGYSYLNTPFFMRIFRKFFKTLF